MLLSGAVFLLYFFPLTFTVYYLLSFSRSAQNLWLLAASLFFYAWGEPAALLLLVFIIFSSWGLGLLLGRFPDNYRLKRYLLAAACTVDIGSLFLFKYLGFISRSVNSLLSAELLPSYSFAAPLGISFFTLRALSYCFDISRGDSSAEKSPVFAGLYIAFFPQLIAGPIVRYASFAEQLRGRSCSWRKISVGVCRFVVGLGKKILLANSMAALSDLIFGWSEMGIVNYAVPIATAWLGAIAFTLQIYFELSGYSDMAIGLSLIFGFKTEENFLYPYAALSMTDFWQCWNISLIGWFREYLPIGSEKNKDRMVSRFFILWLLIGIWHGAEWTFLFWGLWHFLFQLAERFLGYAENSPHRGLMRLYTLSVTMLGWVIFRAKDLYQAGCFYGNMFGLGGSGFSNGTTVFLLREYGVWLLIALLLCTPIAQRCNLMLVNNRMGIFGKALTLIYPPAMTALLLLIMIYLVRGGYSPSAFFGF